jgi:hypothetical protein
MNSYPPAIRGWCSGDGACCNPATRGPGRSRPWRFPFGKGFVVPMLSVPALMDKYGFDRLDILHSESMP